MTQFLQTAADRSRLTVASLNTRGLPLGRSRLANRYRAIGDFFEASTSDLVSFQEIFTYYHLRQLIRHMPSFRHVSYRPSLAGPAGGLATLSRLAIAESSYLRLPVPRAMVGLPRRAHLEALLNLKGVLVTFLRQPRVRIVNTHLTTNLDDDWSHSNRFYPLHQEQLDALAGVVRGTPGPSVVSGDFNIARDSALHRDFMAGAGLRDTFDGRCPPTLLPEYVATDKSLQCIDFILTTESVDVETVGVLFADKLPLADGPAYVSDHIGLRASILVRR